MELSQEIMKLPAWNSVKTMKSIVSTDQRNEEWSDKNLGPISFLQMTKNDPNSSIEEVQSANDMLKDDSFMKQVVNNLTEAEQSALNVTPSKVFHEM